MALIGPSGAGKSSFLRCLNGFVRPSAGQVTVDGTVVTRARREDLRRLRARVAFVFQQFNLLRRLTVLDNVLIGRLAHAPSLRSLVGWFAAAGLTVVDEVYGPEGDWGYRHWLVRTPEA